MVDFPSPGEGLTLKETVMEAIDRHRAEVEENIRLSRELERRFIEASSPERLAVYWHLRWHSQHPGVECPICCQ